MLPSLLSKCLYLSLSLNTPRYFPPPGSSPSLSLASPRLCLQAFPRDFFPFAVQRLFTYTSRRYRAIIHAAVRDSPDTHCVVRGEPVGRVLTVSSPSPVDLWRGSVLLNILSWSCKSPSAAGVKSIFCKYLWGSQWAKPWFVLFYCNTR